jgi:type VI secretion system protein ImpC
MTTATERTVFRNRIKELLPAALPAAQLEPLAAYVESKLPRFQEALAQLVAHAVGDSVNFRSQRMDEFLAAVIAGLRARVSSQIAAITGHPQFVKLEATNKAVEEMVFHPEGEGVKKRILNVSLADMRTALADANGVPEDAVFYGPIVRNEFHRPGGRPNKFLVLTEDVGPEDAPLLKALLTIAREGHCPVLAQVKPGVVCPQDPASDSPPANFQGLPRKAEDLIAEYGKAENAPLHGVQQSPEGGILGLGAGNVIARAPYHPVKNPAPRAEFLVEEHGPLLIPPQTLLAKILAASITRFGSAMRGIGVLCKQTRPAVIADGEVQTTEIVIDELTETALRKCGLFSFLAWKGRDFVVNFSMPSAYVPIPSGDKAKDDDAVVAAQFQFVMLGCQYGQLLKARLREAIGKTVDEKAIKALLEAEFKQFVTPDVLGTDQASLARKPLARVQVDVQQVSPGVFHAQAQIQPHMLFIGACVTLKLKAEVSPAKR